MKIETRIANRGNPNLWDVNAEPPTEEQIIAWAKAGDLTYKYPEFELDGDRAINVEEARRVYGYGPSDEQISPVHIEALMDAGTLAQVPHDTSWGRLIYTGTDDNDSEG